MDLSFVFSEGDAGVVSTESERVGDSERQVCLDGLVRSIVKIAFRIRSVQIDCWRADSVTKGEHRGDCLGRSRRSEHVSGHGLDGTDVSLVGKVSECVLVSECLGDIV